MRKLVASTVLVVAVWVVIRNTRAPQISPDALLGLWAQADGKTPSDELRFYYFHTGGQGLYRYGQVGHNQTNSFDWFIDGNQLTLTFRKTGERAVTKVELSGSARARTLTLLADPRGVGVGRYTERQSNIEVGPMLLPHATAAVTDKASVLDGRIWMQLTQYATGGSGFVMYQLSKHACPRALTDEPEASPWRLGWYHRGDFDDWTTETLCYRSDPASLSLAFAVRGERASTAIELSQEKDKRVLIVRRDPRNFLHRTQLIDGGPSF